MNNTVLEFAGQAGFIFQSKSGFRIGIDLYLSDCCNRHFGFKRLMPYIYNAKELDLDLLIATHAHYDHFDPDSIPTIMKNKKTRLLCAKDCKEEAEKLCLDENRITYIGENDVYETNGIKITAMPCDHGKDTPYAIGLFIEIDGKKIYIAGDTCMREDNFKNPLLKNCDIMIMPINGAFGNLNEKEGAIAASIVEPRLCVPCHYWNFAEHFGNPHLFMKTMDENYPHIKYNLMRPEEKIIL